MGRQLTTAIATAALSIAASATAPALLAQAANAAEQIAPAQTQTALSGRTSESGLDLQAMDRTANPCDDFYQFACGGWMVANPVPAHRGAWSKFGELQQRTNEVLHDILEKASAGHDPETKQLGDYYAACMDGPAVDAQGLKALEPELNLIAALRGPADLPEIVARLHTLDAPPSTVAFTPSAAFFTFQPWPDFEGSQVIRPVLRQGGLGLRSRDDYVDDAPNRGEIRAQYVRHVAAMLRLAGDSGEAADRGAEAVMRIETTLARAAKGPVEARNPVAMFNRQRMLKLKMTQGEVQALMPAFDWARYLRAIGAPASNILIVTEPEFFKTVGRVVEDTPIADLRAYLRWHLLHSHARVLPTPFANEHFHFYGTVLTGATDPAPRWQRCVERTDTDLGDALGRAFVARTFSPTAKADTREMVRRIEAELERDIAAVDWMSQATKREAVEKLHAIMPKIGYPDRWRDDSALRIVRGDAVGNELRASAFAMRRAVSTIGQPSDRTSWQMTPPTANAYTNFFQNSINVPAGIVQRPFYAVDADAAINYGGIGTTIGHELTHGFDDLGRHFDGEGKIRDWWEAADAAAFTERAACFVDEFSQFSVAPGVMLNGKLTVGENISEAGGVRLAFMAYLTSGAAAGSAVKDGFTSEQRFFVSYAQKHCENIRPEAARQRASVPVPPGRYRVNGTLQNLAEFRKAFACNADAPMVRARVCQVW